MELADNYLQKLTQAFAAPGEALDRSVVIFANALWVLANKLNPNMKSNPYKLASVFPYKAQDHNLNDLLDTMISLGYRPDIIKAAKKVSSFEKPCLLVDKYSDDKIYVVYQECGQTIVYEPATNDYSTDISSLNLKRFKCIKFDLKISSGFKEAWFKRILKRFTPLILCVVFISIILHFISLGIPLYIIYVYANVITTHNLVSLPAITIGMLMLILAEFFIRSVKSHIVSWLGARVDYLVTEVIVNNY